MKKFLNRERIIALVCLAFAVYIWVEAGTFPVSFLDSVGPSAYPRLLAILIGGASLILLFMANGPVAPLKGKREIKSLAFIIAAIAVYLMIFTRLGFIISTTLFLLAITLYFDRREWKVKLKVAVPYSVCFSVLMYFFFAKMLGVLLPSIHLF